MNSLAISDLSFEVREQRILDHIGFTVAANETLGIIGPNGSGKTTLFNVISGFCLPSRGTIIFKEQNIAQQPAYKRARLGIGRVFQNVGIFKEMTVLENMLTALESRSTLHFLSNFRYDATLVDEAMSFLSRVKLHAHASKKAAALSGGQLRLLEMVRCLAFGADLFLLDEPTAGVSPKMKEDVAALISELRSLGKTLLVIEHDLNFIEQFCARIVVLDQGRIVMDGSPAKVRGDPMLQEIYFGSQGKQHNN